MKRTSIPNAPTTAVKPHLVCGSGGTHAFLTSAGAMFACEYAGIKEWETIGGCSGGSIAAAFLAGGFPASEIINRTLAIDIAGLFPKTGNLPGIFRNRLFFLKKAKKRIREGVLSSTGLGKVFDELVPEWPENFWVVAVSGGNQLLFTKKGVWEVSSKGKRLIAKTPPKVSTAIRASCAVPGFIEAVPYHGRYLFDGALSVDGPCPTGVPLKHFDASAKNIVAIDMGNFVSRKDQGMLWLGKLLAGALSRPFASRKQQYHPGIMIRPTVSMFKSLQFDLNLEQKQHAVLEGFKAGVYELATRRLLTGEKLSTALKACESYEELHKLINPDKPLTKPQRRHWFWPFKK